jgi:F0F1-type ATP synthase membrane subunit a
MKLLIAAAALLALSPAARPALRALFGAERAGTDILLVAIPFLMVFVPIILGFMALIVFVSKLLEGRVPERVYTAIEYVFVAGIALGIFGMFQPWLFPLFRVGFLILFASLLGFMIWSHVLVKRKKRDTVSPSQSNG